MATETRLELNDPQDYEVPPLKGQEDEELMFLMEDYEEYEHQRLADLFGPKPGRWETEWN